MSMFLQLTISGLSMGMIYAMMAMGLVLLVRAVGVMNFAQGDLLMLGAYITYALTYQLKLPLVPMLICAIVCFAIFALIFMFSTYWPVRKSSWPAAVVICTIGASMAIKEAVVLLWGRDPITVSPLISGSLNIGSVVINNQYIIVLAVSLIVIVAVFTLFEKVYAGRLMQAAAQDKYMAGLLGIPTMITTAATYILVMSVAGIGGYLVAPIFLVNSSLGSLQLRAFAGAVVGGYGNLKGAVFGSIIIGLIEAYSTYFTTTYKDAVVFLVLVLVLVLCPRGLFGERISDKA